MSKLSGFKSATLDLKLISLVKANPVLYDQTDPRYMDFNAREVVWHKIGDGMKRSASECKARWMDIRDINRRILSKTVRNQGAGCKMYKYYNELAFMRPFYRDHMIKNAEFAEVEETSGSSRNRSDGNDDLKDQSSDNDAKDPFSDDDSDSDDCKPIKPKRSAEISLNVSRKRVKENDTSSSSMIETMLDDTADFNRAAKVDSFLRDIGATLKTFSPYHLNLAKSKIFSIVQELELQQIVSKQRKTSSHS